MMPNNGILPSSFRDPSGFVFRENGTLYRQVNRGYQAHFDQLIQSGLYEQLIASRLLIPHEEVGLELARSDDAYKVIRPRPVPFVSYPYEWCFSQLKDAALATLAIQRLALDRGLTLKDSSAYNIQFVDGKPVLIDTLSFETYREGQTWVAYRQFCQHFLAPLALMAHRDVRLLQLLQVHIDGVPLDLASQLLPVSTKLRFSLATHVHLHARSQQVFADRRVNTRTRQISRHSFRALIDSLESAVNGLHWRSGGTEWADYYQDTNYTTEGLDHKKRLVASFIDAAEPRVVWDLGANTGLFSRVAAGKGLLTLSFDVDPSAVEQNYRECKRSGETRILPLLLDLTNPSPAIGWNSQERMSATQRGPADLVMALALIHHLAISNNVPLENVAGFLAPLCERLIIEFVPKTDSQVQRLLARREDVFPRYDQEGFERAFAGCFAVEKREAIRDSQRTLYLMRKRTP